MLSYVWRAGDKNKGVARLKALTLWQYAGFRGYEDKRRWPRLRESAELALTQLAVKHGLDWSEGGDGPNAVYQVRAPSWWRDRIVHRTSVPLISTAHVPRTAAELEAARRREGLTQLQLAASLGVGVGTVNRWSKRGEDILPAQWGPKLAQMKLWK